MSQSKPMPQTQSKLPSGASELQNVGVSHRRKHVLYLPSTPLNILLSFAHAVAHAEQHDSVMVIIDQPNREQHPYLNSLHALAERAESPFISVEVLCAKQANMSRLKLRQQNFSRLTEIMDTYQFEAVAVGSDRRIEFQFCMHYLQQFFKESTKNKQNKQVEGWYLDDGLYSYMGNRKPWYENLTNKLIKKIIYGSWWQEPITVGASGWIQQAWLFDPCNAVLELKNKTLHKIDKTWFREAAIEKLANELFLQSGVSDEFDWFKADLCILLPHPNNIKKMPGYAERLHGLLDATKSLPIHVAVKYHPRTEQLDALGLAQKYRVSIIPSSIAFEFVLMKLSNHTKLIGDVGSALLTAKWLRPEISSVAVFDAVNSFENKFKSVLTVRGVQVQSVEQDLMVWLDA